jgi:hypothetical protein
MNEIVHVSYAHNKFLFAQEICYRSALRRGEFSRAHKYRVGDLSAQFRAQHASMLAQRRGAGYWLWKPEVIRSTIEQLQDGDVVMYTDSGTYFTGSPRPLLDRCEHVLGFYLPGHCTELRWTKADARHAIGRFEGQQMCATVNMFRKTKCTVEFLRAWIAACIRDKYHLLDDSPSVEPNDPDFQQHRWDQSLFSLTYKSFGFDTSYPDPTQWGNSEDAARRARGYSQFLLHHRSRLVLPPFGKRAQL